MNDITYWSSQNNYDNWKTIRVVERNKSIFPNILNS